MRSLFIDPVLTLGLAATLTFSAACGDDGETTPMMKEGPGAALKCTSSGKNAFSTYGVEAFVAVNKAIFANVNAEIMANGTTNVGDSFSNVQSFPTFEGRLAAFLVWVYGGPETITYTDGKMYEGSTQDMEQAHAGMGITSAQYDYFVANIIVPALVNSGVPMDDVGSCFAPVVTDAGVKAAITEE
jgi:hypothetical protein